MLCRREEAGRGGHCSVSLPVSPQPPGIRPSASPASQEASLTMTIILPAGPDGAVVWAEEGG